nr:adenylyl-sulfate kinase [uncultured Oscillibacter sp.]
MKPFVVCFTGISGSGKSTLASAVADALKEKPLPLQIIDGDVLRSELGNLFGYAREERMKQNQIVKVVAKYLLRQEVNVLISIVAPYDEMRKGMREFFGENFYLVYVKCPSEICAERDVKGYYRLSRENQMHHLNGVNDIYEVPEDAELTLDTSQLSLDKCVERILSYLREREYAV